MLLNPYTLWLMQLQHMKEMTLVGMNCLIPAYATFHTLTRAADLWVIR